MKNEGDHVYFLSKVFRRNRGEKRNVCGTPNYQAGSVSSHLVMKPPCRVGGLRPVGRMWKMGGTEVKSLIKISNY